MSRCFSNKLRIHRLEAAGIHDSHLAVHSFEQPRAKGYTARNEFNVADRWQDKGIRSVIPDTRPIPIYRRATGNVITFGKQVAELAAGKPRVILKYLWRGLLCRAHKRTWLQKLLSSMLSLFMVTVTESWRTGEGYYLAPIGS